MWVGVLSGFGTDSFEHVRKHGLDYPLIVHCHAVAFVGWLALFTVQVGLIRNARPDLHRRLGMAGAGLAAIMVVLGPATALFVDNARFRRADRCGAAAARPASAAHKRLMLLGLIYISDAGFARLLNDIVATRLGQSVSGEIVGLYLGSDVLMLGVGAYDLITRRRLHPAYVAGVMWMIALQFTALMLLHNPAWKAVSLHLIGH